MPLYAVCKSQHCAADILAKWNVSNPAIFQGEARLWLTSINRRLGGRRRIRNPFFGEISRDIPFELFSVVVKLVKATPTYCEPFCYYSNNKKGEVISFTSLRLVVELLSLLSGYTEEEVVKYFKRNLTAFKITFLSSAQMLKILPLSISTGKVNLLFHLILANGTFLAFHNTYKSILYLGCKIHFIYT
jgi:hypothetical protein